MAAIDGKACNDLFLISRGSLYMFDILYKVHYM